MSDPIAVLMDEHQLILRVLGALAGLADQAEAGAAIDREEIGRFATFFREFADRQHHGKEEDRLFTAMEQAGMPREGGPIAVMLYEHDEGRGHVRALAELAGGRGALTDAERAGLVGHARAFIPLLAAHIAKEDNVLYPMARRVLDSEAFQRLSASCEDYDADPGRAARVGTLRSLAEELVSRWPAPSRPLFEGGCCG